MHRSRGFIDFRADQRRPPGSARNDVFSRQSESPDKHDVPSNLSEAVQRAVRMRDRIENRYERSGSQVRARSRGRVRSRSRSDRSKTRSLKRSRSKSTGRGRSRSRPRSRTRSTSRGRSIPQGASRAASPRYRSRSRGRSGFAPRSSREQSPARFRRSVSRGRSTDRDRSPGRYRRNGRVSRFEPQESRDGSQSRSRISPDASSFTSRNFLSGALSRFETPPSPKIESLSPGPLEERPPTEDLYDGLVNDGGQIPTPSGVFLNPTFRPIRSPRRDRSRSPKLLSPVNAIYPDVPAEVPQDVVSKALSGSSPKRPSVADERYREILMLRERLRLAEERHLLETRQETIPRSFHPETQGMERDSFDRQNSHSSTHERHDYRAESHSLGGSRRSVNSDPVYKGVEGYDRSPSPESSRQDLSESVLLSVEKELGYGRIPPRRSDPTSTRSRLSSETDADLQKMQFSIEQLKRQIQEKEAAAQNFRCYNERSLSRNDDTSRSGPSGSSLREFDRRNFRPDSPSPESSFAKVQDAALNRELFSRRSRSPYGRRSPSPYERRPSAPWPRNPSPPTQAKATPGAPAPPGLAAPLKTHALPAFLSDPGELQNILYRANNPEQFNPRYNQIPPSPRIAAPLPVNPPHPPNPSVPVMHSMHATPNLNLGPNQHPPSMAPNQHPSNMGPHQHPSNIGPHQHPQSMGPHQHPQSMGPHQHPQNMGPHQHPPNLGPHQHPPNMGPHQHPPNMGSHQHPLNMGSHQHSSNMGPHQHPLNIGPHQHPSNIGPHQHPPNMAPNQPQGPPRHPFDVNPAAHYEFAQRAGPANHVAAANISAGPGRDRPNLKTLTGTAGEPPRVTELPAIVHNTYSNAAKRKRLRKKKNEISNDAPSIEVVEIGSDMELEEEESPTKDVSGKPEEKYAEEIKSYLRLTQRKDSEKERLVALKSEMSRISKLQADLLCLRKKFPDDPTLGKQLSNAAKLYDEAKKRAQSVHSQSESLNQDIFKIPQKIKLLAMEHEALFRDKIAQPSSKGGSKNTASAKEVAFKYVDRGEYFCSFCKQEFRSISNVLSHLHSNPHILNSKQTLDRPWVSTEPQNKGSTAAKIAPSKIPAKGAQFLMGIQGFYCRLCKSMFPDNQLAEEHILSESHNRKYKEYIGLNPFYERRVQLEKEILVHTVSAAAAPRQPLGSPIKSPSQPPGVESESEKHGALKDGQQDSHKNLSSEGEKKDDPQGSNQNPLNSKTTANTEKKIPGTPVATPVSMNVASRQRSLARNPSNSQKSGGGIRLKLLKSTSSSQPLIVGKAPFKRKSQDTQEESPPQNVASPLSNRQDETPFVPSEDDEELEEF